MKWSLFGSTLLACLVMATCARNPVTGKREVMFLSEEDEIAMGTEADPEVVAEFGLLEHPQLQAFIREKGMEMAKVSHRPGLPYQFKILDSPVVNAFALPGGYVYFTRGILAHFNSEAQFSGVLGHEIGHITARHGANQYSKQLMAELGLAIGSAISPELEAFSEVASFGMQLLFMKHGRADESQSDELGVEYATRTGYDGRQMAEFFKVLDKIGGGEEGRMPTFLSTHPAPLDRYKKVGELTQAWQSQLPRASYTVQRDSYLRRLEGLAYGEDPQQGFVEKEIFYHPGMAFSFPVPKEWELTNTPTQVTLSEASGNGMLIFDLAKGEDFAAGLQETLEENELDLVRERRIRINGFQALEADLRQKSTKGDTDPLEITLTLIQDGNRLFRFIAVATGKERESLLRTMAGPVSGFRRLTDPDKLNREVDRLHIAAVSQPGTLGSVLSDLGMPAARHDELALLNGMELTATVSRGTLLKVIRLKKTD